MDGVAATRAIRRLDERIRHIPIVAEWSGGIPPAMGETTPATPPVLDLAVPDAFDGALGEEEAARFSGKFRRQLRGAVAGLMSADDPACIAREAHKLISLAGNLGCVELVGFARNLCVEAERENGDVAGLLIDLPATVDRAVAALAARYPR